MNTILLLSFLAAAPNLPASVTCGKTDGSPRWFSVTNDGTTAKVVISSPYDITSFAREFGLTAPKPPRDYFEFQTVEFVLTASIVTSSATDVALTAGDQHHIAVDFVRADGSRVSLPVSMAYFFSSRVTTTNAFGTGQGLKVRLELEPEGDNASARVIDLNESATCSD